MLHLPLCARGRPHNAQSPERTVRISQARINILTVNFTSNMPTTQELKVTTQPIPSLLAAQVSPTSHSVLDIAQLLLKEY